MCPLPQMSQPNFEDIFSQEKLTLSDVMATTGSLKVAVIGCGSIGTAIASGILDGADRSDLASSRDKISVQSIIVTVATPESKQRVESELSQHRDRVVVKMFADNVAAMNSADVIIMSVKPFKRRDVLDAKGVVAALRGKLLISVMAGIKTADLNHSINPDTDEKNPECQIVRVMTNMAARIRQASTIGAFMPRQVSQRNMNITNWIFRQVGEFKFIAENHFDITGVLVGCSGSLIMLAIDGLLDAAVCEGLRRPEAQALVVKSAIGMLGLLDAGEHPSVLREKIASPGGCSSQALLKLEESSVRFAYSAAMLRAAQRSKEMSGV